MIAFFCSTPFQIMSAVVIKENGYKDIEAVLYILDYFDEAEKYVEKLKIEDFFKKVKFVRSWKIYERACGVYKKGKTRFISKLYHSAWRIYYYTMYERILQSIDINVKGIEQVFFSYGDPICYMLGRYRYKKKSEIRFIGYEDGNSSYLSELDETAGKVEKLFHIPNEVFEKSQYWIYRPDQIVNLDSYIDRVCQIRIADAKCFSYLIDCLWKKGISNTINESFIFFDGLDDFNTLNQIVPKIIEICGIKNILFKEHPRRKDDFYKNKNLNLWEIQSVPFEIVLARQNIDDKVLICNWSSACFNAKLIFDQEPTIIFLCNIVGTSEEKRRALTLISKCQAIYTDKNKIYIPDDIDDLIKILKFQITKIHE